MSSENPEATIFPNPTSGQFEVRAAGRKGNLEVTDMLGRQVYQHPFDSQAVIDLTTQRPGVYQVKITDQRNRVTSQRLVLQ